MGIMIGIGTVLADDPLLTCRLPGCKDPIRIICDTNLRIPEESKIVRTADQIETLLAAGTDAANKEKSRRLQAKGIRIVPVETKEGHIDLCALMRILGERQIDSILLEGGAALHAAALESGIVNKVRIYIAPKIFGGTDAKSPVGGCGVQNPGDAWILTNRQMQLLAEDIVLDYKLERRGRTVFTGLIEEIGTIAFMQRKTDSAKITVKGTLIFDDLKIGDSVAVNGVCLTVTGFGGGLFHADIMNETLRRSNLGDLQAGSKVNLERAMRADGRFGGHIVSGHIDGVGKIMEKKQDGNAVWITVSAAPGIMKYVVEKGSIAIDGISLTIALMAKNSFSVSIIPHTGESTVLLSKRVTDFVNLENDITAKYIERLSNSRKEENRKHSSITAEYLTNAGF